MPTAQSMVGNEVDDDPKPLHGQAESQEALLSGKQNNYRSGYGQNHSNKAQRISQLDSSDLEQASLSHDLPTVPARPFRLV
ncbi:MAG: hypothetical protein QOF30_3448 [Acidimicrobiaceae bacterium]|jgi:hypothetical protein|nr:hypothetical protein [Acidimicrobiaceae bacterium]